MKFLIQILLFSFLILGGCGGVSNSNLTGTWNAVSMKIDSEAVDMDLSEVRLIFDGKGGYNYHSTLNYRESGFYQVSKKFLFTIDTLNEGSSEKKVEILDFNNIKMSVKMQERDEVRVIVFERE